jgi:hypothetical protein
MDEKLRVAKKDGVKVDMLVPLDKTAFKPKDENDCFGREWDMGSAECPVCAMCDICCIVFQDTLAAGVKIIEDANATFLDKTDFAAIDEAKLLAGIFEQNGKMQVGDLIDKVMKLASTADEVAAVEWIKRFIKSNPVKTVGGILWKKD